MMLEHKKIQNLSDFFTELGKRREKGVYFYRINGYSEEIGKFLYDYYDAARKCGVIIEGKIPNPTEGNLAYYYEMMGNDFQLGMGFIMSSLKKWLPRMNRSQNENVAASTFSAYGVCLEPTAVVYIYNLNFFIFQYSGSFQQFFVHSNASDIVQFCLYNGCSVDFSF